MFYLVNKFLLQAVFRFVFKRIHHMGIVDTRNYK